MKLGAKRGYGVIALNIPSPTETSSWGWIRAKSTSSASSAKFSRLAPAKAQGVALASCLWLALCYNEYPVGCEHFPPLSVSLFGIFNSKGIPL